MKKFSFSLDSLLDIRQLREVECARDLNIATVPCQKTRKKINEIQKILQEPHSIADSNIRDYLNRCQELLKQEQKKLQSFETVRMQKEKIYLQARQEKEILSRLKENQKNEYINTYKKKAQQELNEVAQEMFIRKGEFHG